MKTRLFLAAALLSAVSVTSAAADPKHEPPPPYKGSAGLELIKGLEGEWKGSSKSPEGENEDVDVTYRVTSNGSAVVETIFKDTPMEMTSVYFDEGGKLTMTHYCAIANRPTLEQTSVKPDQISLSFKKGENLDPKKDMHIHGLEVTVHKDGTVTQRWKGYEKGKHTHDTVVKLERVSGSGRQDS